MLAVTTAYYSKSITLSLTALIIAIDWGLSNIVVITLGSSAIYLIACILNPLFAYVFWRLWRLPNNGGGLVYPVMFAAYAAYLSINIINFTARGIGIEVGLGSERYAFLAQNIIFILILLFLIILNTLNGFDARHPGAVHSFIDRITTGWRRVLR